MKTPKSIYIAAVLVGSLFLDQAVHACTGIRLTAGDGTVVSGRTMEFAIDTHSEIMVSPRGFERTGTTPDGKEGLKWKSKYASVGANGLGLAVLVDGLNEKGLGTGIFYFPAAAGYMPYTAADAGKTIAPWELVSWILDNCASVEEVKAAINNLVVPAVVLKAWNIELEVHYIVHDAIGKSIVIEYVDGKLHVYDNPLGVITNAPTFDWQMTNLRNYLNFSMHSPPPIQLGAVEITQTGMGAGMLGLPGDFTPPSRFVRAVAFSQSVQPYLIETGDDTVLQVFHILNQFDIPKGPAREHQKDEHGNFLADYTLWTVASNLKDKRYFFRTYENSQIRSVDLMKMNLDAKDITTFSMKGGEVIKSLNPS
jgi:choloylglycine hydrolase